MKRIPVVAARIGAGDLVSGVSASLLRPVREDLIRALRAKLDCKHVFLADSATSCLYIMLVALQTGNRKTEVILPAYTADSVVFAIRKAGLRPVLCDISLDDFNMDLSRLREIVSDDTLAIVAVHAFGVVSEGIGKLRDEFPGVHILEDCAQSMGSRIGGEYTGNLGCMSFFSFNRGKNVPTYGGGAIVTNSRELLEKVEWAVGNLGMRKGLLGGVRALVKLAALSVAMRPAVYAMLAPFTKSMREQPSPENFEVFRWTGLQAGVATSLLKGLEDASETRYNNGMALIEGLENVPGLRLPVIAENTRPAFNRLPVVFEDVERLVEARRALSRTGIETSRMYLKALGDGYPNATYLAQRLLTLPTHPLLTNRAIKGTVTVIAGKQCFCPPRRFV